MRSLILEVIKHSHQPKVNTFFFFRNVSESHMESLKEPQVSQGAFPSYLKIAQLKTSDGNTLNVETPLKHREKVLS